MRTFIAMLLLGAAVPGLAYAQTDDTTSSSQARVQARTASNARYAMTEFGCTNLHSLHIAPDGTYHANCTKGGSAITVKSDHDPTASQTTGVQHVTEGRARYAMTEFGCTNISTLGTGPGGIWHAQCTKGGAPVQVVVGANGVATAAKPTHLTEPAARSILTDYGCASLSSLSMAADGAWYGQCVKGGSTQRVSVNTSGQVATR